MQDDHLRQTVISAQGLMARVTTHLDLRTSAARAEREITAKQTLPGAGPGVHAPDLFVSDLLQTAPSVNHSLKTVLGYDVEQLAATRQSDGHPRPPRMMCRLSSNGWVALTPQPMPRC